jgi:short subunit dehydrogenase-like uncharacterized protein
VLKLFPKHGNGGDPLETIVTRISMDRDPYEVTAITCVQVALALAAKKEASLVGGFQTPVSAVGGQEILERCFECFRVELVSRL